MSEVNIEREIWKMILSGDSYRIPDSWNLSSPLIENENGLSFDVKGQVYNGRIEIMADKSKKCYTIHLRKHNYPSRKKILETISFEEVVGSALESLEKGESFTSTDLVRFGKDYGLIDISKNQK